MTLYRMTVASANDVEPIRREKHGDPLGIAAEEMAAEAMPAAVPRFHIPFIWTSELLHGGHARLRKGSTITSCQAMEERSPHVSEQINEGLDEPSVRGAVHRPSTVWAGAAWMIGLSLLLFFIPAVNGLIAGAVGGYLVGSWSRALTAAILPAIVVAVAFWVGFSFMGLPVIGFMAGSGEGTRLQAHCSESS